MDSDKRAILKNVAVFLITQITVYYGVKLLLTQLDPTHSRKAEDVRRSSQILRRLNSQQSTKGKEKVDLCLNEYEQAIASEIVFKEDIHTSFADIGGLQETIVELRESVILPLTHPELFKFPGVSLTAPKGVLLFGPPGCGKSMLARAVAAESGATFININISTLTDKWFGESNKLIAALFSVARKLQPTIIFVDEIDSFLRERQRSDHEAMAMIKAEFMSLWDGLRTREDENRIVILGATNRREDIDPAILRRMPKQLAVSLPDYEQRLQILQKILLHNQLGSTLKLENLARNLEGLSGSSIKELCRAAASIPHREYLRTHIYSDGGGLAPIDPDKLSEIGTGSIRSLEMRDFQSAIHNNAALSHIAYCFVDNTALD